MTKGADRRRWSPAWKTRGWRRARSGRGRRARAAGAAADAGTASALVPRLAALADENEDRFFGHLESAREREALMKAHAAPWPQLHHLKASAGRA